MKLFLASSADKTIHLLPQLAGISPEQSRVAFITNASDLYMEEAWWVNLDRDKMKKLGYKITETDIRNHTTESFQNELQNMDIIHFCGGNTLYLLGLLQKQNLVPVIREAVKSGNLIFTGTSAGSMIAGPDLALEQYSGEATKEIIASLEDFKGLGLVDFMIAPHAGNKEFNNDYKLYIDHLPDYDTPIIFLYDNQAIWIDNENIRIVNDDR